MWGTNRPYLRCLTLSAIALAVMMTAVGCGSSSNHGRQSAINDDPSITKDDFIKKADAICRRTDSVQRKRLAAYEKAHPTVVVAGATGEKIVKMLLLPPIATEIQQIAALGFPRDTNQQLKPILAGWKAALRASERDPGLIMGFGEGPFGRPDKLAATFGFSDCAKAL